MTNNITEEQVRDRRCDMRVGLGRVDTLEIVRYGSSAAALVGLGSTKPGFSKYREKPSVRYFWVMIDSI